MKLKYIRYILVLWVVTSICIISCDRQEGLEKYPENIGDISFDPSVDDPNFEVCNDSRIVQHYAPYLSSISTLYEGDKYALENYLTAGYANSPVAGQSGFITTRFVVNCKGETGRFRVETMDAEYKHFEFDDAVKDSIVGLITSDKSWKVMEVEGRTYDYYVYVSVELVDGVIKKVLP